MSDARNILGALLIALSLTACPEPPPVNNPSGPQGPGGQPPQGVSGQPSEPGTVGENLGAPPDGQAGAAAMAAAPNAFAPPGFASLIKDGNTITINGTLVGADKAQVDFTLARKESGQVMPFVVEIIQASGGKFQVTAPATYSEPFYISAVVDSKGDGPTPDDRGGMVESPLTLEGQDLNVEITITDSSSWQSKLPWFRGDALPPSAAQPPTPPANPSDKPPLPEGAAAPEQPASPEAAAAPEEAAAPKGEKAKKAKSEKAKSEKAEKAKKADE